MLWGGTVSRCATTKQGEVIFRTVLPFTKVALKLFRPILHLNSSKQIACVKKQKMAEPSKVVDFTGGEEPAVAKETEGEEAEEGWADLLGSGKLKKKVLKKGTGERPDFGQEALIHYRARPASGAEDVYVFDTRANGGKPVTFRIGEGDIIAALDLVTALMNEGEVALIESHSSLAYQHRGLPPHIAPDTDVVFEVEFVGVGKPPADLNDLLAQPKEKLELVLQKKERGNALFKVGDYEGAVKSYTQALKILRHKHEEGTQPPQPDISGEELTTVLASLRDTHLAVCNNTCQALIKADQWAAAKEAAAEALSIDANNVKAVFRMAEIMMKGYGEHEEARQLYLKAQSLDPKDPAIRAGLAQAIEGVKKARESEKKLYQAMVGGNKESTSGNSPSATKKQNTDEKSTQGGEGTGKKLTPPQVSVTADESDASSPGSVRKTPKAKKERTGPAPLTPGDERRQGFINMMAGIVITLMIVYLAYTLSGKIKVVSPLEDIEVAGGDFGEDGSQSEHPHHEHTHSHDGDGHSHDEM